jgi:hypothetical protein
MRPAAAKGARPRKSRGVARRLRGRRHGHRGRHLPRLGRHAAFAQEVALRQDRNHRFLALLRHDRQLHLAGLDVEDCIRRVPLRENGFVLGVLPNGPTLAHLGEQGPGVEGRLYLPGHPTTSRGPIRPLLLPPAPDGAACRFTPPSTM